MKCLRWNKNNSIKELLCRESKIAETSDTTQMWFFFLYEFYLLYETLTAEIIKKNLPFNLKVKKSTGLFFFFLPLHVGSWV